MSSLPAVDPAVSPCPVCTGSDAVVVSRQDRHRKPLTTVLCRGCGHVYNAPIPTDEALAQFYATRYRVEYKGAEQPRPRQIVRNFARVETFYRTWWPLIGARKRVLDAGSGSGEFLFFADRLGLDARGIEPSRDYSAYSRDALGLKVETTRLDDRSFEPESLDFIRLNHVLEHLNDPVAALARLQGWLAPDGLLYVEVPDVTGYAATKSRGNMFHYGHISNFSPWTLRAAAGRAGLEELESVRDALGRTTGTFFRKGPVWSAAQAANPANAASVEAAIARHYAGGRPLSARLARLADKLRLRISEVRLGRNLGEPAAIGRYFLDRFRADGHGGSTRSGV